MTASDSKTNPIDALFARANLERAAQMRAYHKTDRKVLGVSNPKIDEVVQSLRSTEEADLATANVLWQSGVFDARVAAGKMLTRGKLSPAMDVVYWQAICGYAPEFDGWAIADSMATAAHKRILKPESRYLDLAPWSKSQHLWTKRVAMVYTLPFARLKSPSDPQHEALETILSWAAEYTQDPEWFIQKSIAWWLRERSKHDPSRVRAFLEENGTKMKPFARKEAGKYL